MDCDTNAISKYFLVVCREGLRRRGPLGTDHYLDGLLLVSVHLDKLAPRPALPLCPCLPGGPVHASNVCIELSSRNTTWRSAGSLCIFRNEQQT